MNKIRIVVSFLLFVIYASIAQNNKKECTISNCVVSFSEEHVIKNNTGWAFWFIPADGIADTLSVKMSCVNKGVKTHEPHSHFEDELFYMVEGKSIVHLNGEEHILNQGDAFYAPGNSFHNIRRVDDLPIRYLMFKHEIRGKLSEPFLPGIKEYSMKDCLVPFDHSFLTQKGEEKTMWYLTKEMSAGGLNAQLYILSDSSSYEQDGYSEQEVYFILEGKARVSIDGENRIVEALSSCYCPPDSRRNIQKVDGDILKFIVVRTK